MLEVCFSDSVKGALTIAQNCKSIIGGALGVFTGYKYFFSLRKKRKTLKEYRKSRIELQKQAVPLGGKREDIVGISFGLSEGDIKAPITFENCPRKDYVFSTFFLNRYDKRENMEQAANAFWSSCIEDLEKLKSSPEKIRIWLDKTPNAQCGLLFVTNLLKNSETEIHIVELPEKIQRDDNCILEYRSWGDVEPALFGTLLDGERTLTQNEINQLSKQWELLKEENSPLRVVENGTVISADESYYDNLIRNEFPQKTCKIVDIIGHALAKQKILTEDIFIAKRLQHLINSGELMVIENTNDGFYGTIVSCAE